MNLIAFIGIDGSGKTTQAKMLVDRLKKKGINATYVWCRWKPFLLRYFLNKWRERTNKTASMEGSLNKQIKTVKHKLLNNTIIRWLWLSGFFIDYGLQVLIKIRFKLLNSHLIISDRIFYDSIIDQAVNLGEKKGLLLDNLSSFWMRMVFPLPALVIYIDCPENIALSRTDDDLDLEYLADRRKLYLELSEKYEWSKVDGSLPIDEVSELVQDAVHRKLAINCLA